MLDAKVFALGSSAHDNDMLANFAGFLHLLKGFKPKDRLVCVFGSYGWGGGAVKNIEQVMEKLGNKLAVESVSVKYVPTDEELKKCYETGNTLAKLI